MGVVCAYVGQWVRGYIEYNCTYLDVLAGVLGSREAGCVHCVEDVIRLVSS